MGPGESAKIVGWLCCDPMPPVPLGPTPVITIGRGESCDLTLAHKQVSRVHAVIKLQAGKLQLSDEGSSNGTFVNSRRVTRSPIQLGDQISIGPYELLIRSTQDLSSEARHDSASTTNVMRGVRGSEAMVGRLDEVPVAELLHQLEFNRKTGLLTVTGGKGNGTLAVQDGEPLEAKLGEHVGEEAVIAMTTLKQGRFVLSNVLPPGVGERRIARSLSALLFEASRREDERSDYAYAAPDDPAAATALPDDDEDDDVNAFKDTKEWESFWKG